MKFIRNILVIVAVIGSFTALSGVGLAAGKKAASPATPAQTACAAVSGNAACTDSSGAPTVNKLVTVVINVLSLLVGVVSVIMIIIGGLRYVTSNGDANAISGAKNTIIYAIIGLVVVALAQSLVKFILQRIT